MIDFPTKKTQVSILDPKCTGLSIVCSQCFHTKTHKYSFFTQKTGQTSCKTRNLQINMPSSMNLESHQCMKWIIFLHQQIGKMLGTSSKCLTRLLSIMSEMSHVQNICRTSQTSILDVCQILWSQRLIHTHVLCSYKVCPSCNSIYLYIQVHQSWVCRQSCCKRAYTCLQATLARSRTADVLCMTCTWYHDKILCITTHSLDDNDTQQCL